MYNGKRNRPGAGRREAWKEDRRSCWVGGERHFCNVTEAKGVKCYRDITYDEGKKKKKNNSSNLAVKEVSDHSYGIFFHPHLRTFFFHCFYSERKGWGETSM